MSKKLIDRTQGYLLTGYIISCFISYFFWFEPTSDGLFNILGFFLGGLILTIFGTLILCLIIGAIVYLSFVYDEVKLFNKKLRRNKKSLTKATKEFKRNVKISKQILTRLEK